MKLDTLPGLAAEHATLRIKNDLVKDSVETLWHERGEVGMLSQYARVLAAHPSKIWADVLTLRERNT